MEDTVLEINLYAWQISHLGEMIEGLAERTKLIAHTAQLPQPPDNIEKFTDEQVSKWIDTAASHLGIESEGTTVLYPEVENFIKVGGPAILRLPGNIKENPYRFIALVKGGRKKASILCPDLKVRKVNIETLRAAMCANYEAALITGIDKLLLEANVPPERLLKARKSILAEELGPIRIHAGWILRISPGAPIAQQFQQGKIYLPFAIVLALYFVQILLSVASWFVIGRGIFQGHFDMAWLAAWVFLLLATIPISMIVSDAQAELSMRVGLFFKQRLLYGTLKLDPEEIRHEGLGQFLGRVMESDAVEMLALNGGFMALLSFIELGIAGGILAKGAGGFAQTAMLGAWVLITLFILWRYYRASKEWSDAYRSMTNDLVEEMVGHRTRLAQENYKHWHDKEDEELEKYLKLSEKVDRIGIQLNAIISRGWIIIGLAGIAIPFITNSATVPMLAISLGGVLLASQALTKLANGAQSLTGLVIAWQQVGPLFNAASRPEENPSLDFVVIKQTKDETIDEQSTHISKSKEKNPLLLVRDITFQYTSHNKPVIQDASLEIKEGDHILLEGPSGGGKSTLASILTGLRKPDHGTMLLFGFDRQIIGSKEWRRHVVMSPQFQENHVFSETLGFNLLMGRRWPPENEDLSNAEQICRELGLGDVLDRMPSGFQQILGESGWQLSHGERGRLFIARTLLQNADLLLFDESFGSLDPENLHRALECVLNRAKTILVIAHP